MPRRRDEDQRKLSKPYTEKLTQKLQTEIKQLYDHGGARRTNLLSERFRKEIQDLVKYHQELAGNITKIVASTQERSQIEGELNKERVLKSRLETMCKDLKNKNTLIIKQNTEAAELQNKMRNDLRAEYQDQLTSLSGQLEQSSERRIKEIRRHEELREMLKKMVEEVESRDQIFKDTLQEKETALEGLKSQLEEEDSEEQTEMKQKIQDYRDQFDQFQQQLIKSNDEFQEFKNSMPALGKRLKECEKVNLELKKKRTECLEVIGNMRQSVESKQKELEQLHLQKLKLEQMMAKLSDEAQFTNF